MLYLAKTAPPKYTRPPESPSTRRMRYGGQSLALAGKALLDFGNPRPGAVGSGTQIGRIGWQIEHPGADCGDGLLDPLHFVAAEVVEDNDVACLKCGAQELLDPSQEQLTIHGPVDHHGSGQLTVTQASDKGRRLPITERRRSDASTALGSTAIASRHVGRGPGFIDKYQLFDVHPRLIFTPRASRCLNVLALLFAGVQRFF